MAKTRVDILKEIMDEQRQKVQKSQEKPKTKEQRVSFEEILNFTSKSDSKKEEDKKIGEPLKYKNLKEVNKNWDTPLQKTASTIFGTKNKKLEVENIVKSSKNKTKNIWKK